MHPGSQRPKLRLYLLLVAIQITGAIAFVWQQLPEFEQVVINPGKQLPHDAFSNLVTVGVFCLMQLAFWCRLLYVPIPFRRPSVLLSHLLLFLGRLTFIFGSALFSVAVFRHLPELGREADIALAEQTLVDALGAADDLERTVHDTLRVVLVGLRIAEVDEQPVA